MEDENINGSDGGGEVFFRGDGEIYGNGGAGGGKVMRGLQRSFAEVQGILDQNRLLIQEISQNHEALDADGLTRNVSLIRELNTNITRVVDLYADLSFSFARSIKKPAAAAPAARNSRPGNKRSRPE